MVASLDEEHPMMSHQPFYSSQSVKGNHFFRKSQIYSSLYVLSLLNAHIMIVASCVAPAQKGAY